MVLIDLEIGIGPLVQPIATVKNDLPNMNMFCDWISETIIISVYDSFFREI